MTTLIRLGDRLDLQLTRDNKRFSAVIMLNNLLPRILFPYEVEKENIDYYITRYGTIDMGIAGDQFQNLGEYEAMLLGKIIHPVSPLLCIVGQMGSGKSTTLNLMRQILNRIPEKRLISFIDFRQHTTWNDKEDFEKSLISTINTDLRARLRVNEVISRNEELNNFWNSEINIYKQGVSIPSRSFREIIAKLDDFDVFEYKSSPEDIIDKRIEMLNFLQTDPELYLDYLLRLWNYTAKVKPNYIQGVIILDNIDSMSANIQGRIIDIILRNAQKDGPLFIVSVRPETFDRIGLNDTIFETVTQEGPYPFDVIMNRLQGFIESPDKYKPISWENNIDFAAFHNQLKILYRILDSNPEKKVFREFLLDVCGSSIRSALLLAMSLFISIEKINSSTSIHDIIRIIIREGDTQYYWKGRNTIHNLFRIIGVGKSPDLLIKLRILKLLDNDPGKKKSLEEIKRIVNILYSEPQIIQAINEMLLINSQLIRSNGFDEYSVGLSQEGHNLLILTKIGEGYLRLSNNIDYIQEIMLDCYVNADNFPPKFSADELVAKGTMIIYFLRELLRIDVDEVRYMIKRWGTKFYYDVYGTRLISAEIIGSIHGEVLKELLALKKDRRQDPIIADYANEITDSINNLKLLADNYQELSEQLLGIRVR